MHSYDTDALSMHVEEYDGFETSLLRFSIFA